MPRLRKLPPLPTNWHWIEFEKIEEPNCQRYYRVEMIRSTKGCYVITDRGRIGQKPRRMIERFDTAEDMTSAAKKRARDRLLHRYIIARYGG